MLPRISLSAGSLGLAEYQEVIEPIQHCSISCELLVASHVLNVDPYSWYWAVSLKNTGRENELKVVCSQSKITDRTDACEGMNLLLPLWVSGTSIITGVGALQHCPNSLCRSCTEEPVWSACGGIAYTPHYSPRFWFILFHRIIGPLQLHLPIFRRAVLHTCPGRVSYQHTILLLVKYESNTSEVKIFFKLKYWSTCI